MMRRLLSAIAVVLVGGTAGVVFASGPANAAGACPKGTGVTVVVGSSVKCDANGGGDAANNFADTGHKLTYAQNSPGFVCKVDGAPASDPCFNTSPSDAYWGLFWSDGTSGKWNYSSLGVGGLTVPMGGWLAFAFQNSDTKKPPSVSPIAAAPKPTAKPKPKPAPTTKAPAKPKPTTAPATPGATATATTPTPTASATTATPTPTPTASTKTSEPSATPATTPTEATAAATTDDELINAAKSDDDSGSGGLIWVAGGIGVLLIAGMGATVWRRRAAGGPS